MKTAIETWTAYEDFSGVNALIVVDGVRFACSFTSDAKVQPVGSWTSSGGRISKKTLQIAKWLFGKALDERTTPEYRAATVALYQS